MARSRIETVDEVLERIRVAQQHIDRDRPLIAPDCGLGMLTRDLAVAAGRNVQGRGAGLTALVGPAVAAGQVLPRRYPVMPDGIHQTVSIIRLLAMRRLLSSAAITARVGSMARSGASEAEIDPFIEANSPD